MRCETPAQSSRSLFTLERYENAFAGRHLLHGAVDHWASRMAEETAVLNATRGTRLTWRQLRDASETVAGELLR